MKTNVLRAPLIKSAVILILFSLLFYITATTADGSVWSSIGIIFIGVLKAVQWLIGMAIGLAVCIAVLIGIFLGAVALGNPASASRMYEGLRSTLLIWLIPVIELFKSDRDQKITAAFASLAQELKKEITEEILANQNNLHNKQTELNTVINNLSDRLAALEETAAGLATAEQAEAVTEEIKGTIATVAEFQDTIADLESKVAENKAKTAKNATAKELGDLTARVEAVEQQENGTAAIDIAPMEKNIVALQTELAAVQKKTAQALQVAADAAAQAASQPADDAVTETTSATAAEEEEHRIFSYFDDPAEKKKVAELVASTLKQDMSYKQVMDFVAKGLGSATGKIFTSHPSLSKDYIRQCRRNN